MSNDSDLVSNFFSKSKIKKPDSLESNTGKDLEGNRSDSTTTTNSTIPFKSTITSMEAMVAKYRISPEDRDRRKRRYSYELFENNVDLVPKIARKLSALLDVRVSDSALVRKYIDEGIKKSLKELGLKLEDFS